MPKHITLSRRKQSEPADLDTFKEKRAQRESQKKKRKEEQEQARHHVVDQDDDDQEEQVQKPPKRLAIAKEEPKKKIVADEASDDDDDDDDDDDVEGFSGEDDEDDISNSSSSSLSVGDVRNEFEALQSSLEQGLAKQKKRKQSSTATSSSSSAAAAANDSVHPDLLPAVMYVGHIPYGFHERQLEAFFGQFGEVSRVKLARSKRTGGSRHFAFVEFRRLHVAKVVVEAMNGYIMFRRRLVCAIVPPEKCHDRMWSVSRKIVKSRGERRALSQLNYGAAITDAAKAEAAETKRAERDATRKQKLASLGIDLDSIQRRRK
jgi:nucleolar protein 15